MTMKPFADDSASTSIGELAAENGSQAVTLSGSLEITRDKVGLERAKALRALADALCEELESGDLPDKVEQSPDTQSDTVANPFA